MNLRGETALHLACLGQFADCTQWLLGTAPELVDVPDLQGNTPLHVCAAVGNLEGAVLLLRAGANTAAKNSEKKTAFDLAKIRSPDLNNTHNPELVQVLKEHS